MAFSTRSDTTTPSTRFAVKNSREDCGFDEHVPEHWACTPEGFGHIGNDDSINHVDAPLAVADGIVYIGKDDRLYAMR